MAAQQGFQYEENAAKILKKKGIVPKNFQPAGASHDQPDLMLEHKGEKSGCELKITAASAGSASWWTTSPGAMCKSMRSSALGRSGWYCTDTPRNSI